ncbi:MAG: glucose-6-phosphate isomerase, partial [Deltaproteobacteria bacterium]|nr:glucose-6-phosphate isomerase [Deltaproteobacteria bacterium]
RTLVNVVSKSGTTLETRTNETLARQSFEKAGLAPERHFLCVTGEGSPMDDPKRYRAVFHMYDYVGGRFSATSMVGGVPLGFGLGLSVFTEMLRGAREMDLHAITAAPPGNLPLLMALLGIWNRNFLGHESLAVLPYSQGLSRFGAHLQQLDMESNGKGVNHRGQPVTTGTGPIVWGEPGTNGQHAFYQLIHQSPTIVPCEFIGFRQNRLGRDGRFMGTSSQQKLLANLLAQSLALATGKADENPNRNFAGNRPSLVLMADQLTPHTMGGLLALYEHKISLQGFMWGINSFDQEGVELGKIMATSLLEHLKDPDQTRSVEDDIGWALLKEAGLI